MFKCMSLLNRVVSVPFIAVGLSVGLAGCGGGPSGPPENTAEVQVKSLITSLPDAATAPAMFREMFVGGQPPEGVSAEEYVFRQFEVESVEISDGKATAEVRVQNANQQATSDDSTVQWALVSEAEGWKLQDAPLP